MMQQQAAVPVDPEREAAFIAVVEGTDCRVDPAAHPAVHAAGFSDAEIGSIGAELVSDERAELAPDGTLILMTANCL
jgi:hypothetical protein